jgi:hypothetical protein
MKIGTLFASNPHVFALFPHLENCARTAGKHLKTGSFPAAFPQSHRITGQNCEFLGRFYPVSRAGHPPRGVRAAGVQLPPEPSN